MISKKHKKFCTTLNYIEDLVMLASTFIGYVAFSAFAPLVGIPISIASSTVGLKICAITARIKKYKSIIDKKKEI